MPIQAPSWTDFLNCPICCNEFAASQRVPISLGCGHTICKLCLTTLYNRQCPFDQTLIVTEIDNLPINYALLQLVGSGNGGGGVAGGKAVASKDSELADLAPSVQKLQPEQLKCYKLGKKCIEDLALHLKSFLNLNSSNLLTRPMQRKLVTLVNCQLMEEEGRVRALRAARSLGERTVTELILQHQNPQQLSSNLWAAVRTRGCQFLGPAMQEEVLKLVLLALEEGSALSRKVLVMFVVQRLEPHFPQASKTSIGHVVQLLYRASCFKVSKREADSSLMQLKEEFRTYDALRREHDAQIVQIATEAGLRIAPEQWSSLLYGDIAHKSHMQSIIDKLQTPSSFAQSVQELVIALQRTSDPAKLSQLHNHLQYLASIDPCVETAPWEDVSKALDAVRHAVMGLVHFLQHHGVRKPQDSSLASGSTNSNNTKYKISLCRDLNVRRVCPRGASCTFAHSQEEVERYRARNRGKHIKSPMPMAMPNMPVNNNGKKSLPMGNEVQQQQQQQQQQPPPPHAGPMMPISPIRYMQASAPPPPHRGYLEPLPPAVAHNLSPSGVHGQLMHPHHSPIARQQQQQQQQQHTALNGLLVAPPGRYEPRFNFGPAPTQPRNAARDYAGNAAGAAGVQRNPPNYNSNNNNNSNSSQLQHNHAKSFCSMLPTDVYHSSFFGNTNTINNNNNNNDAQANSKEQPPTKLGQHLAAGGNPGNPWEHTYMQQQLATLTSSTSSSSSSSKNPNRPGMSTILPATADTSFYEKKPPSNVNIDLELVKPMGDSGATNPDAMPLPLFRSNHNTSNNSGNNNNTNTSNNSSNNNNSNNNNSSLIFWSAHNKDSANFVRSDSILDDDASPYEVPSGSSMHSRYGPICPKRSTSNWNNWMMENDVKIGDNAVAFNDRLKTEHNDNVNPNANKNSAGVFIWNDLNANATSPSSNYWSNNTSDADAAGVAASASQGERLKHHLILDRKPQLLSEDSFEGGIDSGMMSELEKNLVDIVEVWSNPDDSGIKLD
ncbi:roquin-1 [Drosophila nasuta]|uniref:roquin-1 n=1 Tax=Drosophila nasuta TaxID=42062 RepID=UPI00295EC8FD|nr:roquin-1 [Drosophila nasuta]